MRNHGITQAVLDYLMWHHFGASPEERAHDLVSVYRHYFNNDVQPKNLAKLTEQYIWRDAIDMERENNMDAKGDTKTLKVNWIITCKGCKYFIILGEGWDWTLPTFLTRER